MFPLKKRKIGGYKFLEKTFYSAHHLGVDYSAHYNKLYTPFDGKIVRTLNGKQGGLTIWLEYKNYIIRFLHLSEIRCKTGEKVKKGQTIGITGNTGKLTTAPHLHLDISKNSVQLKNINNFIDPEKFNWDNNNNMYNVKSDLKNEIEKITKDDYGKTMKEKEQKQAAKDLKKYRKKCKDHNELRKVFEKRWIDCKVAVDKKEEEYQIAKLDAEELRYDLEKKIEKNKKLSKSLGGCYKKAKEDNEEIDELMKTIVKLQDLKAKNYKAIGILKRLAEAIRMVLKF